MTTQPPPSFSRKVALDPQLIMKFLEPTFREILAANYIYACTKCKTIADARSHVLIKTSREMSATAQRELSFIKDMLKTTFGHQIVFPSDEEMKLALDHIISENLKSYKNIIGLVV